MKKITKQQLQEISKIATKKILKEEAADCVRDYMAMGYSKSQAYKECEDYPEEGYGSSRSRYQSSPRKTSYVGADANAAKIEAIEAVLAVKWNNYLGSILDQLNQGRGLSSKQKMIVKKILMKSNPESANLFEGILKEGNHAVDYALGYEDARDGSPKNSNDPWYSAGYEDFLAGIHDQYRALTQDGMTNPAIKENKFKITKRQLRRIIREEYSLLKRQGLIKEYGLGDEFDAMRNPDVRAQDKTISGSIASVDWIKFHHDPYYDTNQPEWQGNPQKELDAFLDLIISSELKNVLVGLDMPELYRPAMNEIDYEGIYNSGKTIMSILKHVFPNTNQSMLTSALQQWALENTRSGKVLPEQMP